MLQALTRDTLDDMQCGREGCDCRGNLFLTPACHPQAGLKLYYHDGILEFSCHQCEQPVAAIQVAMSLLPQ